ncbi:MAG: ATP-binding protein [Cypionkella sp.]
MPEFAQAAGFEQFVMLRRDAAGQPSLLYSWSGIGCEPTLARLSPASICAKLAATSGQLQDLGAERKLGTGLHLYVLSCAETTASEVFAFSARPTVSRLKSFDVAALCAITQGLAAAVIRSDARDPKMPEVENIFSGEGIATRSAEAELLRLGEDLPDVLASLEEGVVIYDAQDRFVTCNMAYRQFYNRVGPALQPGTSFADIARYALSHGQFTDVKVNFEDWLESRIKKRSKQGFERSLPDGRILHVSEHVTASGARVEVHGDITRLKIAEQRLYNIVNGAQVCVWDWNVKTGVHRVNEYWAGLLGYTLAELEPVSYKTWRDRVHPDDLAATEALFDRALVDDTVVYSAEYRLRHRDGHWIWVLDSGRALHRGDDGRAELIAGLQVDISAQKAREAALAAVSADLERASFERARLEQRLVDIVSVSDGWLWEMDADCRYSLVLDGQFFDDGGVPAEGLFGLTQEEWLAAHPDMLVGIDWTPLLEAINQHQPFRDFIYRAPKSTDGETRWRRMTGSPVFDEAGSFIGYRGVGSDVTELYLAKGRAEEASHTKSMFLANMSHEIRTPLNGVLGMAEVLDNSLSQPDQKRMIGTIRRSGEALLTILNDILDMSKIEAGKMELEVMAFNPVDLAERVEDLHALRAEEKGLAFEVLLGSGAEATRIGDPYRVQQILHNLISNAIKFTDKGAVVVKIGGREGQPLTIEVQDSGIGMSPDQVARLHEEFSQADSSVTRRFGGTGLGMAITLSLVESMGGEISVDSALGQGTTIKVVLPLIHSAVEAEKPVELAHEVVDLQGVRILAADDNATNCVVLEMMLTRLGAEVTLASDGAQAVQAWDPEKFDCVLLDIAMPVMDGPTALAAIRAKEAELGLPPMPIIAATANVMAHQIADYLALGFDSVVSKPITAADLSYTVRALLRG